ncbi:MAG: DUF4375 domain-containing protein [Planctomycetota bacterium]
MLDFLRRLLRRRAPARFDAVFGGPDDDLVLDLVARIEGPDWRPEHLLSLPEPWAHVVTLCRFDGIFGNGGLQYWFECDTGLQGTRTCAALRAVGLPDAADALAAAYQVFPTQGHYDDMGLRMATLRERTAEFEPLEQRLWEGHERVMAHTAAYARANRAAFEDLRRRRPWHSLTGTFGDA